MNTKTTAGVVLSKEEKEKIAKEKAKERARKWREENRERYNEYRRQWVKTHKEQFNMYQLRSYHKNKVKRLAYIREYQKKRRAERFKENIQVWNELFNLPPN